MKLRPFEGDHAPTILGWASNDTELGNWASLTARPSSSIFTDWHADADVHAYVLHDDDVPIAYGEIWVSREDDEVELARILVSPLARGRGVGRALVEQLLDAARAHDVSNAWVRIVPDNEPAIRCYRSAGFEPVSVELEQAFNAPQPREYRWLRRSMK